jgi:PRTRC genetic system protein E
MFKELGPLLRQRTVVMILTRLEDDSIRVNVIPRKLNESDNDALTTPLSVVGTAEDLDNQLPSALVQFVGAHLELKNTLPRSRWRRQPRLQKRRHGRKRQRRPRRPRRRRRRLRQRSPLTKRPGPPNRRSKRLTMQACLIRDRRQRRPQSPHQMRMRMKRFLTKLTNRARPKRARISTRPLSRTTRGQQSMSHNHLRDRLSVVRGRIEAHQPVLLDPGGVHKTPVSRIVGEDALHRPHSEAPIGRSTTADVPSSSPESCTLASSWLGRQGGLPTGVGNRLIFGDVLTNKGENSRPGKAPALSY